MRALATALLAASALLLAGAGAAQADVEWLCRPGEQPNPCRDTLETTVYDESGGSRVENPPLPADPPADCFYVYPTVSEQPSRNANKEKDAQVTAIARYQAARFSQVCRVYAPMYRQQTLGGLAQGGSAEALQLAYGDVAEAWREYLAKHNRGRPVVLIGHSQGTRMLRQLVRTQIDPDPEVRQRLVSAIMPGANVTVAEGTNVGGDFQNVPGCTSATETGCVMAWSTFNEAPPDNTRFGKTTGGSPANPFNFPIGPGYEVLCTNPASLGANEQAPLSTYLRSEPFPGVIGALLVVMYGGPPPSAPTPWIQPQDHYTGRCVTANGANVLMTAPVGSARHLNPSPDPSWGLHLADLNIALGNLIGVVESQESAYLSSIDDPCATAIRGGKGRDRLIGTPRGDRISALAGNDSLRGRQGDDCLRGQRGGDRLEGGPGHDALVGGTADDRLNALDGGRDTIRCGAGDDIAKVDRVDRVRGDCETVRRPKSA